MKRNRRDRAATAALAVTLPLLLAAALPTPTARAARADGAGRQTTVNAVPAEQRRTPIGVRRLLVFAGDATAVTSLPQIERKYGVAADGINFYYGIGPRNRRAFARTGNALCPERHRPVLDALLEALLSSTAGNEKTVVLSLEPPQQTADPFAYVEENLGLASRLAVELADYQRRAREAGKTLRVVIRYASEMNDAHPGSRNRYAGRPAGYRRTFRRLRRLFRDAAPDMPFTFSPALRSDLSPGDVARYWPGADVVDIVSCTWYVGADSHHAAAAASLSAYLAWAARWGKPLAIDEMGGCTATASLPAGGNDAALRRMLTEVAARAGAEMSHVTLFLRGKWGRDATLFWLRTAPGEGNTAPASPSLTVEAPLGERGDRKHGS